MRRNRRHIDSRYILFFLVTVSVIFLFLSYVSNFSGGIVSDVASYIFVPMQKGISYVSDRINESAEERKTNAELIQENKDLKNQVEELRNDLSKVQLEQNELDNLRNLYGLSQTYSDYNMTGARVIARGSSNWFSTFTIDKGSNDGIEVGMNVLADGGLCGIVTKTGKNYSIVRSIIDDTSNVSTEIAETGSDCIVSGSLKDMTEGNYISLTNLEDADNKVVQGNTVVTSNISDKYLPGILIGYVSSLSEDSNHLTKSGTVTPVVDFKHLSEVLVIMQLKETGE